MSKAKQSFEESMERLEKIVAELETGNFSLEESLEKFEEGMKLGNVCKAILDKAESKVRQLVENADGTFEEKDVADEL